MTPTAEDSPAESFQDQAGPAGRAVPDPRLRNGDHVGLLPCRTGLGPKAHERGSPPCSSAEPGWFRSIPGTAVVGDGDEDAADPGIHQRAGPVPPVLVGPAPLTRWPPDLDTAD